VIHDSILDTIGTTPVIRLNRIGADGVTIYAKVEAFNPMGSVKDRLAHAIIRDAEQSGRLRPGQTVVEATSGNTGISLAMVCAARGYPFVATMVETFSVERRQIMRALGAKVILTPAAEKASGMVRAAEELAERHGWFLARQFENPANPRCHRETTAREILADFAGLRLDYWVTGYGSGGTMSGAGEELKRHLPDLKVIAWEPESAGLLLGGEWKPHRIQGVAPNFIPAVMNPAVADEVIAVSDDEAKQFALRLAREEGIFAGLSAGATLAAALRVAAGAAPGSTLLVMLPDTGERYLSTYLCEGLDGGSDELEPRPHCEPAAFCGAVAAQGARRQAEQIREHV
jgi:cysteine synthase A